MPPKKRTRSASSSAADDANNQSDPTNKRTNKRAITASTRPVRGALTRAKLHGASVIRPNNQTIDFMLMYPFVLPLVVLLLNDADVLTSLLVTCKTIKLVMKRYEIKLSIAQSIACQLLDVNRYLPSVVTAIHDVSDVSSLVSFPSLAQLEFYHMPDKFSLVLIPRSVKQLTMPYRFNEPINPGDLPDGLETLIFSRCIWFRYPLQPGSLPESLTTLIFEDNGCFGQSFVPGVLPIFLRTLKLGDEFIASLASGSLPDSLTVLDLGKAWNHPLTPGMIPDGVSRLALGENFNQPLTPHTLPPSLTYLRLGFHFNQTLDDIPSSVTHLLVNECEKHPIVPNFVTHLCTSSLDIPRSVTHLVIEHRNIAPGSIPDSVTHLVLRCQKITAGCIPDSVTHLRLDNQFTGVVLPGMIPSSVVSLRFGPRFNQSIQPGTFPNSLIDLTFGESFDRALGPGVLPASLKMLTVPVCHIKRINLGSPDTLVVHADVEETDEAWWL